MKEFYYCLIVICMIGILWVPSAFSDENSTLTEQLELKASAAKKHTPAEKQVVMEKAIQDLRASGIEKSALKKGEFFQDFTLPGADGREVSSAALLKEGPLVITFYRGGWCPYCNLQLRDLQKHLPEIRAQGAQLVAISPQTPDATLSTAQKENLEFHVLSDLGGRVARLFGLMYKLPPDLVEIYKGFGLDLAEANGNENWELPLAATYVVSQEGKVVYSFVNADYKKRAETLDVLSILKELSEKQFSHK